VIVALDAQLTVGTATGAGVYARDLTEALRAQNIDVRALRAPWLDPWRFDRRVLWDQVLLPIAAARSNATLLHATSGTLPFIRTLPTVVTVHDLAWHRAQSHTRAYARAYFGTLQARAYRHAAAIICDSTFTATEYTTLIDPNANPTVIHPGVDPRFAKIERHPDENPFALVVGTVEPRKNLAVLIEALAAIPTLRIISVGPPTPYAQDVKRKAADLHVLDRLDLRGYVTQSQLDDLYARATCALIPSRYEGFGYALAEAMCAGVPAIAANSSSLTELANNEIPLIPPTDATAWTESIRALWNARDAAQQRATKIKETAVKRFAWSTAATKTAETYARIVP
jgi:glycosyltransferase involved in cell wall biosynthesis